MNRVTLLVMCLLLTVGVCVAQDRALVSGDAEDKQDVPVPGIHVRLLNESLRIDRSTVTNSDGFFFFAEVEPSEGYVVEASAPGMSFAPQRVKFDVEVGETRHILPSFVGERTASLTVGLKLLPRQSWIVGLSRWQAQPLIDLMSISWIADAEVAARAVTAADQLSSTLR